MILRRVYALLVIALGVALAYTVSIDFSQDLGRHLLLGEIISTTWRIPKTNLLSYTYPNFPFVNHHWLSEVIFYWLSKIHLNAVYALKILLTVGAMGIASYIGFKKSRSLAATAAIASIVMIPYFMRASIRPEIFGYLLFSFLLAVLLLWWKKKWVLWTVPIVLLAWVNLHSTFIFGYFLALCISLRTRSIKLFLLSSLVLLINPNGIMGPLFPLTLFTNYGYTISENMGLLYMLRATKSDNYIFTSLLGGAGIAIGGVYIFVRKYWEGVILLVFCMVSFWQNRHVPFSMLAIAALTPYVVSLVCRKIPARYVQYVYSMAIAATLGLIFLVVSNTLYDFLRVTNRFGGGVKDPYSAVGAWYRSNVKNERVFNTFDIAGYLAYANPNVKLYVDNRPEAYPSTMFKEEYIPIQKDPKFREKVFKKYGISYVVMNHDDQTYWARMLHQSLVNNKEWNLVYLDGSALAFKKQAQKNDPQEMLLKAANNSSSSVELANLFNLANSWKMPEAVGEISKIVMNKYGGSCIEALMVDIMYRDSALEYEKSLRERILTERWWCV